MQRLRSRFRMDREMMPIDQLFHLDRLRKKVAMMARLFELSVLGDEAKRQYQQRQSYYSKDSGNFSQRVQSI